MPNQTIAALAFPYRVQVLDRAFRILDRLSEAESGYTLADLSHTLGLHKSTAHRLLMVMEAARYVEREQGDGRYRLGSRVIELGLSAVSRLDLRDAARPHLRRLVEESGETAHLAVYCENEMVSLMDIESDRIVRMPASEGRRTPLHCTALGKAVLAFGPPEYLERCLNAGPLKCVTRRTITTPARLRAELQAIRQGGVAIDDGEWETGLRCIGAPVYDRSGGVVAAISISGPAFRLDRQQMRMLPGAVVRTAAAISTALGHRAPAVNPSGKRKPRSPRPVTR